MNAGFYLAPEALALAVIAPTALARWRWRGRVASALTRTVIVTALSLAAGETAARVVERRHVSMSTVLSRTGYAEYRPGRIALRPNVSVRWGTRSPSWPSVTVRTDADGLRVGPRPCEPGAQRALFVGDSFTFGVGLDAQDTVPQRAAELLTARTGRPWCGINAGVPGYNLRSSVERLEHLARRVRPSAIVVEGNLLDDIRPDLHALIRDAEGTNALLANSRLLRLLRAGSVAVRYEYTGQERPRDPAMADAARAEIIRRIAAVARREGCPAVLQLLRFEPSPPPPWEVDHRGPPLRVVYRTWSTDDARFAIPGDGHPNPEGARAQAEHAVEAILSTRSPAR